jgi:hypothetical protein
MVRLAVLLPLIACCAAAGPAHRAVIHLGGTPYALVAGRQALWALVCDRGCTGEARHALGRVVRIDPAGARVVASTALPRPHAIAVGTRGVYALDFWRDRIRLIDPRGLRIVRSLRLRLPFRFSARDNAFLPFAVAVGRNAVWVATDRGALARADPGLAHVAATLRLPFDAFGGMATGPRAVWIAESLAGVYRVDPRTNRVVARIKVPLRGGRFDAEQVIVCNGSVLVLGARTSGGVLTNRYDLARVDVRSNRAEVVTALPPDPYAFTCAARSVWLARQGSSTLERIDAGTGRVIERRHAPVGTFLAFGAGHLWTAFADGTIRQLGR